MGPLRQRFRIGAESVEIGELRGRSEASAGTCFDVDADISRHSPRVSRVR
jgi:hypothetical protein